MCSESYFQDDTVVAVLPSYPVDSEAAQFLERWPSPYVMSVPNQGIYHIDYTGDVTWYDLELEDIDVAGAGEVVAMFGIDCSSMDSFTDGSNLAMTSMFVPEPVMSIR